MGGGGRGSGGVAGGGYLTLAHFVHECMYNPWHSFDCLRCASFRACPWPRRSMQSSTWSALR